MTDTDRLSVLFEEIGAWQRSVDERPISNTEKEEILNRLRAVHELLPPGNAHIFKDFMRWIMQSWAIVMQRHGDAEAEKWRVFLKEAGDIIGPIPE
ncbi:hypothetical protein P3102_22600 [Amycolatopsis sp. QT-25]|uniref:hypothetical protein n=1 Tax=Amycolatopsis sp. QT-25 TaxID=3034022 RepID=UPI0023EAC15F|nr:hypothetical protein [Amycolatopsis sp. QT-25]WET76896.1 hypothetical protein P3102_22600 [Amycolatopsis sp. QT-25]